MTVVAFDKKNQVEKLKKEMTQIMKFPKDLKTNNNLFTDEEKLIKCNIFIITVPTPIKFNNLPDLNLLKEACETVGKYVKKIQ